MARSIVPSPPRLDHQVGPLAEFRWGTRDGRTVHAADLVSDAEYLDGPVRRPVEHRGDCRRGIALWMQHKSGRAHVSASW